MLEYRYDEITKEYIGSNTCYPNPVETEREGHFVPAVSANCTLEEPLAEREGYSQIYNNGWEYIEDHRGTHIINPETEEEIVIRELGEIPEGFILYDDYIESEAYQEKVEREEQERIGMLNMTKYDFYKKICVPNGISYSQLMDIVNSNEEICAAWNLCERVYRGDAILIGAIRTYFPSITDEQLTMIFES